MSSSDSDDCLFDVLDVEDSDGGARDQHQPTSSGSTFSNNKSMKKYDQQFLTKWKSTFPWIDKGSVATGFKCRLCQKEYRGGISEAKKHESSKKHAGLSNAPAGVKINKMLQTQKVSATPHGKTGAIRIGAFVAEHNIAFSAADHLPQLIRAVCPDSNIAKTLKSARTKTSAIIKHVLGKTQEDLLLERIRNQKFSLLIDESTDVGTEKHLALVVRYKEGGKTLDAFSALLPIGTRSTADAIFNAIKDWLTSKGIALKNLIGFGADGANVMMGCCNSVMTKLKEEIPGIYICKCVCHSFALCASYACEKLPASVENTLREIYKYFKFSSQRTAAFQEFQFFYDTKPHKMLHPSATRWLSLLACVRRLLEQWTLLQMFFQLQAAEHPDDEPAVNISSKMGDPHKKLYFLFLDHILPYVVDLNKEMQSESTKLYALYFKIESAVKSVMKMFLKQEYYEKYIKNGQLPLTASKYNNPDKIKEREKVTYGGGVTAYIALHKKDANFMKSLTSFYSNCILFYQELLNQIFKRFSFGEEINCIKYMHLMSPKCVLEEYSSSVAPLAVCFRNLFKETQYNALDKQYNTLQTAQFPWKALAKPSNWDWDEFYDKVREEKDGSGAPLFPLLVELADFVSILPHCTAAVERIFSTINNNKTKIRNKLKRKTLSGILHAKRFFRSDNCHSFQIPKTAYRLITSDDLYQKNENETKNKNVKA